MHLSLVAQTALEQSRENHDLLWAALITSVLGLVGVITVAWLANRNKNTAERVATEVKLEILKALDTGNGHTAGQSLTRIENQLWSHENRLDGIDVRLSEGKEIFEDIQEKATYVEEKVSGVEQTLDLHVRESQPLREWIEEQINKEAS